MAVVHLAAADVEYSNSDDVAGMPAHVASLQWAVNHGVAVCKKWCMQQAPDAYVAADHWLQRRAGEEEVGVLPS